MSSIVKKTIDNIKIRFPSEYDLMNQSYILTQQLFSFLFRKNLPRGVDLVACYPLNAIHRNHFLGWGARSQYVCSMSAIMCEHPDFEEICLRYGLLVIVDSRGKLRSDPRAHV
ncbi:MAG: hypothetical protein ACK56I_07650, partial [bacterium]